MKKKIAYAVGTVVALFLAYQVVLFVLVGGDPHYRDIDSCLDLGGCWDGIDNVCRDKEPNAQELCDRPKKR